MIELRPSTPNDAERVIAIWCDAVDATHAFLNAEGRAAIEAEVRAFLPAAPLWLALDDAGTPVGFALRDGAHLEALFVDPAHHGCGVGRALVGHALSQQRPLSVDVNARNLPALGFYQRLGFGEIGRSPVDSAGRPYPLIHLRLD